MAKGKSFLIYIDIRKNLELLTDEEAGKVFKAIVKYADDGSSPQFNDRSLQVFSNIITDQIDRDRVKYEKRCGVNRENQQKRWKKVNETGSHHNTNVYNRKNSYTNVTDNDTDTDKDTERDREEYALPDSGKFKDWYNKKIQYTDLPRIQKMTDKREAALERICLDYGREAIVAVMDKVIASSYLRGETSKKFKTNFDWLFKEDNFIKVKEGTYDD